MNSLAALSRAFSKSSAPRSTREAAQQAVDALAQELAAYDPPAVSSGDGSSSGGEVPLKAPSAQEAEDAEGPASAYPSPPPTPELPSEATPLRSTLPKLARQLSKKRRDGEAAMVERAARSLPVRLSVAVYMLIRKVLALMGIKIAEPPLLQVPPVELQITPPSPVKPLPPPPSYEITMGEGKLPKSRWPRPNLAFLPGRTSSVASSPSISRRSSISQSTAVAPAPVLSVLKRRKTLVLDLDETLIHSTSRIGGLPSANGRFGGSGLSVRVVEVVLEGRSVVYHVYKRPWVDLFLRKVATWYSVIIFTASMQEYADPVIDWLDGGLGLFEGRHFRESCIYANGSYIKDLSVLGPDADLSRICLVDNSPSSYARNQANGIPIEGFISDPNDQALLDLLPLLDSLRFTTDVRRVLGLRAFGAAAVAASTGKL